MSLKRVLISIFALAMALVLAGLTGCNNKEKPTALQAEQIESYLRDNPDVLLEILDEHKQEVFRIAQDGAEALQKEAMREQWHEDLKDPKKPVILDTMPIRGDKAAPLTIVEYSDFQCPYCAKAALTMEDMLDKYKGKIRLVFKHFPLNSHKYAMIAAQFYEAAALQDHAKAWELHDIMFHNRDAFNEGGEEWLTEQANSLGLDMDKLLKDAYSNEVLNKVLADRKEGAEFGFRGSPSFLVGGVTFLGNPDPEDFSELIELMLKQGE